MEKINMAEGRFAHLLDKDTSVENWLRPAPKQFDYLHWRDEAGDSDHNYEPDFVVELENEVVMMEVKPSEEIGLFEVRAKKRTAEKYCELATKSVGQFGITKSWRYVIVPTEKITVSSTTTGLLRND